MSENGIIFDIKELALYDGPGIRTTVFLKGCPLRCNWCHNPEGFSFEPQLFVSKSACIECGKCVKVCENPEHCVSCGKCVRFCPLNCRKIAGTKISSTELAQILLKDKFFFAQNGGGVTFSGGEPTAQHNFLLKTLDQLSEIHTAIETSGYCKPEIFSAITERLNLIIFDLKIIDGKLHNQYIGTDNSVIPENIRQLKNGKTPFIIRIPLIPNINDNDENFLQTAKLLKHSPFLQKVELLPYHKTAGAKYSMVGETYKPNFDEGKKPYANASIFTELGIDCKIL